MHRRNTQRAIATFVGLLMLLGVPLLRPAIVQALDSGFGPDFNHDGYADLAVGVPAEDVITPQGNMVDAGAVQVLYGSLDGITTNGAQFWHQARAGMAGAAEAGDRFGETLATGDFDDNGFTDLAVGVPNESFETAQGGISQAGVVHVLYGASGGLSANGAQFWHQDQSGVLDAIEAGDKFGDGLVAGDFNGDGIADLAVGVSDEDVATTQGNINDAGAVAVLYGSNSGLTANGDQFWHQDQPNVEDAVETNDEFGETLAAEDFNRDGITDLAVGVAGESIVTPPENDWLGETPDWPMLADFGIAKLLETDQSITMTGQVVGTAAYLAPEQAAGQSVDFGLQCADISSREIEGGKLGHLVRVRIVDAAAEHTNVTHGLLLCEYGFPYYNYGADAGPQLVPALIRAYPNSRS